MVVSVLILLSLHSNSNLKINYLIDNGTNSTIEVQIVPKNNETIYIKDINGQIFKEVRADNLFSENIFFSSKVIQPIKEKIVMFYISMFNFIFGLIMFILILNKKLKRKRVEIYMNKVKQNTVQYNKNLQ